MGDSLSSKTVCIVDQGLFVELAPRLARDFGRVLYYSEWRSAFPKLRDAAIGEGIPGVERIWSLWDHLDEIDLFLFPDINHGDLQEHLRKLGKRVWGSGNAEWLELDRVKARELQLELGLAAPKTRVIKGVEALADFLSENKDKWVKVSTFRGDMESFHAEKPFQSETWLDVLRAKYGPQASQVEFLVEDHVPGIEVGYDGWTVDGKFPAEVLWGFEIKDLGYIGCVQPYEQIPEQIRHVNAAFAPILARDQCRSFMCFEARILADGTPVVIDPMMRCGSPCTEVWMELWENLGEIFWEGAAGRMVQPVPAAKYAAMGMIHSQWALQHWTPIHIPDEVRRWVKIRNRTDIDGHTYFVPGVTELPEIGAVVGLGDTLEEAVTQVDTVADQIEAYMVTLQNDSLDKAKKEIERAEKLGIFFGD